MPREQAASEASPLFVGLNKGAHDSAVCLLPGRGTALDAEILLKERFTRAKRAGGGVDGLLIGNAIPDVPPDCVAENSIGSRPVLHERNLDGSMPYFKYVQWHGLQKFTREFNPQLKFFTHHYCHAKAAATLSPFKNSLIFVLDGGGNYFDAFDANHDERNRFSPAFSGKQITETATAYLLEEGRLRCVFKEWQSFEPGMPGGLGFFYSLFGLYIFNSKSDGSGRVMGLAPLGQAARLPADPENRLEIIRRLDWKNKKFQGRGKQEWEECGRISHYADLAAAAQAHFEFSLMGYLKELKRQFPEADNLILAGGCALNCAANMKIVQSGLFSSVYVPPAPGDDSIALGAACALRDEKLGTRGWQPVPWSAQTASFGAKKSWPDDSGCLAVFHGWKLTRLPDAAKTAAELLNAGKIIAWFQGRSESGPRALGFRSILANPLVPGTKDHLNERIKGRERFRPYGCSVTREKAAEYFGVPEGFESPFMSFAPLIREEHRTLLKEVSHVDGTSRIQTVRESQNPLFYRCIHEFEKITGVPCLLNTSLNVMGEPIAETLGDLKRLLEAVPLDAAVAGNFLISRPGKYPASF